MLISSLSSLGRISFQAGLNIARQTHSRCQHRGLHAIRQVLREQPNVFPVHTAGWSAQACRNNLQRQCIRRFASEQTALQSTSPSKSMMQRIRDTLNATTQARHGLQQKVSDGSVALYKNMPKQAKLWVDSAGNPAAMQRVVSLQLEAFWQRHGRKVMAFGGVFIAYMLWRTIFGMAKMFVNLSDWVAASGFMAAAAASVVLGYLYMRRYYGINPDTVYRMAMARLNTSSGVLEVMGAPVVGSDLRAYLVTGGNVRFKNLTFKRRSKRVQMIFPLTGSERRGLVSLEAKKRKGQYQFKLLAVDVPSASGAEQRLFLDGDESSYHRGDILDELRHPFLGALGMQETYEAEDEADEVQDQQEEKLEQEKAKAQAPKPLDEGGGMYFWERVTLAAQTAAQTVRNLYRKVVPQ